MQDKTITGLMPHKRRGFWAYVRRVPVAYAAFDQRTFVVLSTGIRIPDDPFGVLARGAVARLNDCTEAYWRDRAAGLDSDALKRYERNLELALVIGFPYVEQKDLLAANDRVDFIDRVNAALAVASARRDGKVDALEALIGVAAIPGLMVSQLREEYERINELELVGMSAPQLKRWRTPRDTAVACFIEAIGGDRPVKAISRPDVLKFKTHWQQRVKDGAVRISTANKNIRYVATMFNAVDEHHQLELDDVFRKTRFKGGEDGQRVAFDPAFVQSHFLAEGMFDDINAEARGLIYLICETGLRLSEACNLLEHRIILDAEIPHVQIRPDIAKLKTKASLRDVPLVGVALMAMKANPKGFPRYRLKADALSAWVNYVLDQRKLRPVEGQSLYSLRHTFQDRLDGAKIHEATSRQLMGHAKKGVKYGQGVSLDVKLEALKSIAFTPPSRV